MAKRVAVIGAGPSGLVTVKELLEEGHQPTCFERARAAGGVFRFDESDGVVWDSCRLTSSGPITAFSDFSVPAEGTGHLSAQEYAEYLSRYVKRFALEPHLRFGMKVQAVSRAQDGAWLVRVTDASGTVREERFDAVAVCSGLHQHPHFPRHPGQETFTGCVLHGSQYRRPEQVAGKRVLVVGGGESGGDIAAEVSRSAAATVLSLRRGIAVLPRRRRGFPNDYRTARISNSAATWVFQTRNPADRWKRLVYSIAFFPAVLADKIVQTITNIVYEDLPLFRWPPSETATRFRMRRVVRQLLRDSGGTVDEQFGTKGEEFVRAIATGRCRRAGPIERFEGPRVLFVDGSSFDPEIVIFATGFDSTVQFLDRETSEPARFLHLINPSLGPSFGFIGFVRPAYGAIPPLAELQARYFALLQSGKAKLPPDDQIERSIEAQQAFRRHHFRAVQGRLPHLVDFTSFADEVASWVGCKPTVDAVRAEGLGFRIRFFASAFVAAQYRLVGPHAKPDLAREVIGGLPISHPAPMLTLFYLRWVLSRLLHRALGKDLAPKLALGPR